MKPVTALIADDEAPLREYLRNRLARIWPELSITGEAENGTRALSMMQKAPPDVAFLDIRMPGLSGMELAEQAPDTTHVVFITAFHDHAVEAFRKDAVDYLLKPVTEKRLTESVWRIQKRLHQNQPAPNEMAALVETMVRAVTPPPSPVYLQWIRVHVRDGIRILPVSQVCCFRAEAKYTSVYTAEGVFMIRKPIKELTEELPPDQFWQIHRGTIINAADIEKISHSIAGRYAVKLRHVADVFLVSRRYTHLFRQM